MTSSEIFPRLLPVSGADTAIVRHYRDGSAWRASWQDGLLTSLDPATDATSSHTWIAPGLLDLQVNGYAGVDFQRPLDAASLRQAVRALRRDGCPRFFPTLITAPWPDLLRKLSALRAIVRADAELSAAVAGWHIEGPFLSATPGFCGAHNPGWTLDLAPHHVHELRSVVPDEPLLLTVAPERADSAAIAEAVRQGIVVSFGHTNASASQLRSATDAGGRAFTHLGNGCPQQLDRHDNIVFRAADEPRLTAGLITDGIHVSPALFRLLHRALGPDRIYWTTDAMNAAGGPPGRYTIGSVVVEVGPDLVVRHPVTGGFAGSALTPIEGVRRGAHMLGLPWQQAWDFSSVHPARLLGLPCALAPGHPFCLLQEG